MKTFKNGQIGVDQGSCTLFSDFENGGEMWTGCGPRQRRVPVAFSAPFSAPPSVHVSLDMFDMDQRTNLRADLHAEDVTETGFSIVFKTWGDSRIARMRAAWMAIGEVPDPDKWDLG